MAAPTTPPLWQAYTGERDKCFWDIRLRDGREVLNCWPNADLFISMNSIEAHNEQDVTHIRFRYDPDLDADD